MKKGILILVIILNGFVFWSCDEIYVNPYTGPITSIGYVYPNPAKAKATIIFVVPQNADVIVTLENLTGSVVKELHRGMLYQGEYRFDFDVTAYGNGIFVIKVQSGKFIYKRIFEIKK